MSFRCAATVPPSRHGSPARPRTVIWSKYHLASDSSAWERCGGRARWRCLARKRFFSHWIAAKTLRAGTGINHSATMARASAQSIKFEPSAQPGKNRLLRGYALQRGAGDERSRIRTNAGCRASGDCARPAAGLLGQPTKARSAVESFQRQWAGLADDSISRRLVRCLLIAVAPIRKTSYRARRSDPSPTEPFERLAWQRRATEPKRAPQAPSKKFFASI